MTAKQVRAALYLRVSTTDGQTTENQRLALGKVAGHRGWEIVHTYEDAGISGAKGRDKRPAFDQMLKDAVRHRFDGKTQFRGKNSFDQCDQRLWCK